MPDKPKPPDAPINPINVTVVGGGGIVVIPVAVDITQVLKVLDSAANLQTIDQYKQLQPALQKAVGDLKTYLTRQDAQISSLQNQLTSAQTQIASLQTSNADLTNQVAALSAQIVQLKAQLAAQPQKALPLHVAQSFKNAMDQIQTGARTAGGPQTTITNMQIAVKALMSVQDGADPNTKDAVLIFPDPSTPPDPNLLSTLTVNFGAIPNIKAAGAAQTSSSSSSGGAASSSSSSGSSSSPSSSSSTHPAPTSPGGREAATQAKPGVEKGAPGKKSRTSSRRIRDKLQNLGSAGRS